MAVAAGSSQDPFCRDVPHCPDTVEVGILGQHSRSCRLRLTREVRACNALLAHDLNSWELRDRCFECLIPLLRYKEVCSMVDHANLDLATELLRHEEG